MCGLAGVWSNDDRYLSGVNERIKDAVFSLRHRGPDGNGHLVRKNVALGHTRLSIIDVTSAASQPMVSSDGRHAIVFNGEIYNYKSLFSRYCPQDGSVNGNSDTAVLLYLLGAYGADCVGWLDGMFAFAHVDFETERILLARDRFGEKPLYFRQESSFFAFASELSTLRRLLPSASWELCPEAIALYHIMGSVAPPNTIFKDVFALEPGIVMTVEPGKSIQTSQYWSLHGLNVRQSSTLERGDAVEVTRALLLGAVRSRLVSDVPVGLFLSGGYDSSALMACCAALGHPQTLAVCVDFEEEAYSEFPKARSVAKHYGASVHRHLVTQESFESNLDEFFTRMDQPTGDGYNTFFVCGAAKSFGIKAWLSGVGGDELFGGYQSFRRLGPWSSASRLLQKVVHRAVLDRVAPLLNQRLKVSRILHMADDGNSLLRAYQACRNSIPWRNVYQILSLARQRAEKNLSSELDGRYPDVDSSMDHFRAATLFESSVYMRSQLLRDIDNFSMSHSLELRAPLLEPRLFEAVYSMSEKSKMKGNTIKPLLGASVPIPFPREILLQRKQGFGFPVEIWLRKGLEKWFVEATQAVEKYDIWDMAQIRLLWNGYLSGSVHWSVLWNVFALAKWVSLHCEDR